ncbi:MAG: hypothetical protein ACQESN_10175 [Thermotogota bacterium]
MKKIIVLIGILSVFILSFSFGLNVVPIFTTIETEEGDNLFYSVTPIFDFDTVKIGVGFEAYQSEIGGTFYYGKPKYYDTEPSTNLINAFNINLVEFDFRNFGFRYGFMPRYSFGLGTVMYRYKADMSKAVDMRLGNSDTAYISAHIPFEIYRLSPFEFGNSAKFSFLEGALNVGGLDLSMMVGSNQLYSQYKNDLVANIGVYKNLGSLYAGVESGYIFTTPATESAVFDATSGFLMGAGGGLNSEYFSIRALPVIYMSPHSVLSYVDADYEYSTGSNLGKKHEQILNNNESRLGGLYDVILEYTDIIAFNARYSYDMAFDFSTISNQELFGDLKVNSPFEEYPFELYGYYRRDLETFGEIFDDYFDEDTEFQYELSYNFMPGMKVSYIEYYDSEDDEIKNKVHLGGSFDF